mgnify:CR=1 FL=1
MQEGDPDIFGDVVRAGFSIVEEDMLEAMAHQSAPPLELVELPVDALREAFDSLCDDEAIGQDLELLATAVSKLLPQMAEGMHMHDHIRIDEPSVLVRLWGPRLLPRGVSISGSFLGFLPDETYLFESDMPPTPSGEYNGLYIVLGNAVIENGQGEKVELGSVRVLINDGDETISRVLPRG